MPQMNFDLEDGHDPVGFVLSSRDAQRFIDFMAGCQGYKVERDEWKERAEKAERALEMHQRMYHDALGCIVRIAEALDLDGGTEPPVIEDIAKAIKQEHATQLGQLERLLHEAKQLGIIVHDMVTAEQAAWIEWQHGRGAEAGMVWIHNGLCGPGHIPDEDEPWGKEAQAWYDANKAHPFPTCHCGRPSNQLWMGHGACCDEHMEKMQREAKGASE